MSSHQILLILTFIHLVSTLECILHKDVFLRYNVGNDTLSMQIAFTKTTGWASIAFGKTQHVNNTLYHFVLNETTTLYHIQNFSTISNSTLLYSWDKNRYRYESTLSFSIKIPINTLQDQKFIFIKMGFEQRTFDQYSINQLHDSTVLNRSLLVLSGVDCLGTVVPQTIHAWTPFSYGTVMIMLIICFVLFFIVRDRFPIRSHGLVPYAMFFSWFLGLNWTYLLLGLWDNEVRNRLFCLSRYLVLSFTGTAMFSYFFHYARYLILLNLNAFTIGEIKKNIKTSRPTYFVRMLRFISKSRLYFVSQYSTMVIAYIAIGTIVYASVTKGDMRCDLDVKVAIGIYCNIITLYPLFFMFVLSIIDMVIHVRSLCTRKFWFGDDPFLLRIECAILPIGLYIYLIVAISPESLGAQIPIPNWVVPSFSLGAFIGTFCIMPMFSVILTYYSAVKMWRHGNRTDFTNPLQEIFEHQELLDHFRDFAKNEFSMENVIAKEHILAFKRASSREGQLVLAQTFVNRFLLGGISIMTLNVDGRSKEDFLLKMSKNEITPCLFDEIETHINENLSDTMTRYMYTPQFEEIQKVEDLKKTIQTLN